MTTETTKQASSNRSRRFMIGLFLGIAFFLVEAGVAEVFLGRHEVCNRTSEQLRFSLGADSDCLDENSEVLLQSLSRGVFTLGSGNTSAVLAWLIMSFFYGLAGGVCAQFKPIWGIGLFIGLHLLGVGILSFISYLSNFIVF